MAQQQTKYVFVTGGVVSSLGKGMVSADRRILHSSSLKGRIEVKPGDSYRHDQSR